MPSTSTFSDLPFTVTVASETVFAAVEPPPPVEPLGVDAAVVGGDVGGDVFAVPPFELLEQAASAIAASTAAAAILTFVERIRTSLSRGPRTSTTDVVARRFNDEPHGFGFRKLPT